MDVCQRPSAGPLRPGPELSGDFDKRKAMREVVSVSCTQAYRTTPRQDAEAIVTLTLTQHAR
jgi:hypothetical protein